MNLIAQPAQRRDPHQEKRADAGGAPAQKDSSVVARKRAFLTLEAHRESLAATAARRVRARSRYEDLCLVKMVTRLQRDYLSQPSLGANRAARYGEGVEALEYRVADWARPWGPSCLLQLQADLNLFDRRLKASRRWLTAAAQREAEARAGERFVAIMARMGGNLEATELGLPSWASSTQPTSPKRAARRGVRAASRPGAPRRTASRRAEPRPVAPGRDGPGAAASRRLDVNHATLEQLRGLGLSITQSRRLLAYRKRLRGFDSIDQLDEVPGFPEGVRDKLSDRLTV